MKRLTVTSLVLALLIITPLMAQSPGNGVDATRLARQVRHELAMLPFYSVFDSLRFQVVGNNVILSGDVVRPTLKSSAERVVQRIEGVASVENRIKVLPLSNFDDQIRVNLYWALFGNPNLSRYSLGATPAIHIIVDNGNVRLEGAVASPVDKTVAGLVANGVSGVFSVKNDLVVASAT